MVRKWTTDRIVAEAKKYGTKADFERGCRGAYEAALRNRLINDLFSNQHVTWTKKLVIAESKLYDSRKEFGDACPSAYQFARRQGFLDELFDSKLTAWTKELVIAESKLYPSRVAFAKGCQAAYKFAVRNKFIDELFERKTFARTDERVIEAAKKFRSKAEFGRAMPSDYQYARATGLIDKLFGNTRALNTRDCVYIWAVDSACGIYKVGVTSRNLGVERILDVARVGGFSRQPEIIVIAHVGYKSAKILEAALKKLGRKYKFERKFSGHTEFRQYTPSDIAAAMQLINEHQL